MIDTNNIIFIGNWQYCGEGGRGYAGATWSKNGLCATLNTMSGGNREPMVLDIRKEIKCKHSK